MNDILDKKALPKEEQAVLDRFLADNRLFLGPDPEIMRNHSLAPRTVQEDTILKKGLDVHQVHHIRGLINAALSEAFQMVNQMGAAPGAKWGDLVTGIFTTSGDLAMIAPHGIIAFAACCFYPIKFIIKNWIDDPSVGVKDGDGFIHNDARYGGVHNTDQSMMMPLFYKGELVCWLSSTIHEGENGACEPGGMPAAAESKYDEGIKMSPFKVVENFQLKRDLVTFLQNSVRDPKLQLEDMKVKLHAVMRLRERITSILDQYGKEALIGTLRSHLEDVEVEMRRRITELPDGTTRVNSFMDSSLRENCIQKIQLAITVKGDRMILDFRGSAPQFLNRYRLVQGRAMHRAPAEYLARPAAHHGGAVADRDSLRPQFDSRCRRRDAAGDEPDAAVQGLRHLDHSDEQAQLQPATSLLGGDCAAI
jgi:N-methylhydantoinase B/oxoprolinase/acetone carboxylase alpha subunit